MGAARNRKEPLWLGGAAACMAVCFTHPLDQTKYRMQVLKSKESMLHTMFGYASRDGILSLSDGLSASILRQGTYSTARFGIYNYLTSEALQESGKSRLPLSWNIAFAGIAGGVAGLIGNPTEVVLVRMCADAAKPKSEQFGYPNAVSGLGSIWSERGVAAFSKGLGPNIARSVLMNVSQIATYTSAKQWLVGHAGRQDDITTHAMASFIAGTVATTICSPADVLKSRIQSSAGSTGLVGAIRSGLMEEGPRFLMKGWMPAWLRLTPHTVLTFAFMEQLRRMMESGRP